MSKAKKTVVLRDAPEWTPAQMLSLDRYLTHVIAQCTKAIAAAGACPADDDEYECWKRNRQYWRHAASAIRWVRGQLRRQRAAHVRRDGK